jgi:hypothetical protein
MTETKIFPSSTIGYCEKAFNGDLFSQNGIGINLPGVPRMLGEVALVNLSPELRLTLADFSMT